MIPEQELKELNLQFADSSTGDVLQWAWDRFGKRASIGTSFQGAGLVMIHLSQQRGIHFPVFTLDTGLLFPETMELKGRLEDFFGFEIEGLHPDLTVEQQEEAQGPDLWKRDPDLCCTIRKVEPPRRHLASLDAYVTGLRRDQNAARGRTPKVQLDASHGDVVKINPIADWNSEQVWSYVRRHNVPVNRLHRQGYPSVGCEPCTRAVEPGADPRSGRWWWENADTRECGLHHSPGEEQGSGI